MATPSKSNAGLLSLSPEKITLLSIHQLTSGLLSQFTHLLHIVHSSPAHTSILPLQTARYALLHFLPESTAPGEYISILRYLFQPTLYPLNVSEIDEALDITPVKSLKESTARRRVAELEIGTFEETITEWLKHRVRRIDHETGDLSLSETLLLEFLNEDEEVQEYFYGTLMVVQRLVYEFDCGDWDLARIESLDAVEVVRSVLAEKGGVEMLDVVIKPFLEVGGRQDGWEAVWDWIKPLSWSDGAPVLQNWRGPALSQQRRYVELVLEWIYGVSVIGGDKSVYERMRVIGGRLAEILNQRIAPEEECIGAGQGPEKRYELLEATPVALTLLFTLLMAAEVLGISVGQTMEYRVDSTVEKQLFLLNNTIRKWAWGRKSENAVEGNIREVRWLKDVAGVFGKIQDADMDALLLTKLLDVEKFRIADKLIIRSGRLTYDKIQEIVLFQFDKRFNSASNGNKTRGRMSLAAQSLDLLRPSEPSPQLLKAKAILSAVHSLSSYTLSFKPGIPAPPREIRAYEDPFELIEKLLEQNQNSYTHLEPLIRITRDLVTGSSADFEDPIDPETVSARIESLCVQAALTADDFASAYSLISSRILPAFTTASIHSTSKASQSEEPKEETWKPIILAAKFHSRSGKDSETIDLRLELAAQALRLCPKDYISEILGIWRRLEEEYLASRNWSEDAEEARANTGASIGSLFNPKAPKKDRNPGLAIPGGFGGIGPSIPPTSGTGTPGTPGSATKIPFNLTQGLGRAVWNKIPVGQGGRLSEEGGRGSMDSIRSGSDDGMVAGKDRQRKRDVVSGMVTSGLVSGIGWVLGAQPQGGK
ncbi:secretory pathway Sec39 [Ascobolus immersus RN42]|uniref:Secretory pathway Sec39 n=1 Tax=Ascobolus immersus RN42 TaxID=1160509 RepID=A0A3N4IBZ3_ASCIM|nr:secretory pathway Sec39 [Ascobolus immersus RN42]